MFRAAVVHAVGTAIDVRMLEAASLRLMGVTLAAEPATDRVLLYLTSRCAGPSASPRWLRAEHADLPVIVNSSNHRPRTMRCAQQFGAAGFVSKAAPVEVLSIAVEAVLDGGLSFHASRAKRGPEYALLASRLSRLTSQQFRVLKLIAVSLGRAGNTVKIHVTAVLSKLECRSRT